MRAKDAVRAAKKYIVDLFQDEEVRDIGLEELEYRDGLPEVWEVTIGFRRVWKKPDAESSSMVDLLSRGTSARTYKTVRIRDDGKVLALKHREVSIGK